MELILLLLVAGVIGYFLAGSRASKPIDNATAKVSETSKNLAGNTKSWWGKRFGKRQKTEEKPAETTEVIVVEDEKKPAEKSVSRRKSDTVEDSDQTGTNQ